MGFSYFSTIISRAAITSMYEYLSGPMFSLFLGMSGIAGSYGKFMFKFSKNCKTVLQRRRTSLRFLHTLASTGLCLSFVFCLFPLFCIPFLFLAFWLATCALVLEFHFDLSVEFLSVFLCVAPGITLYTQNLSQSAFLPVPVN